jgi:sporulation protein YlmC with PRC-barrel domain
MWKVKWVPGLAVGALIGSLGFAAQVASAEDKSTSRQPFRVQKASDLIGKSVENNRGEKLGEVQDLAVDPDRGRVAYAVVSFGGFLGMGEKWFAVPIGALTLPDHAKHFVLAVEKDRLKKASGFDKDRWPTMGDSTWGQGIHEFYAQRPYWMDEGQESLPTNLRIQKASEIFGMTVQNDRGEKLGEIKDLVIDPDRGRIAYAVLTFGGFLGLGDKLFAIPTGVIQMPGTAAYAVLSVDKDRLKSATGFDKDHWPNLADPTFSVTTYKFYDQKPYWTMGDSCSAQDSNVVGKFCAACGMAAGSEGLCRDGKVYCCTGCANGTGCTSGSKMGKTHP